MISEQLGHNNIKTTEIYLGSFEKKQRQELSKHLLSFKNTDKDEN
jgi:integrase